ncbi:MAG: hypothetical protein ABIT05_04050 [Chitinophagaceae bacterium]
MKRKILPLIAGCTLFVSCMKEDFTPLAVLAEPCKVQTDNPSGRSYVDYAVLSYDCTDKHCGMLPLSTENYWIYLDSVYINGEFSTARYDTLRYTTTYKTLPDGLVWWQSNINVGLPDRLYSNDSALFKLEDRLFTTGITDAKKEYSLFPGDSLRYLASFEDAAAIGRSLKLQGPYKIPAGSFSNCFYFEKNARNYRRDQVYFKPGIGVLKYIREKAPLGQRDILLEQVSTLVAFHIE